MLLAASPGSDSSAEQTIVQSPEYMPENTLRYVSYAVVQRPAVLTRCPLRSYAPFIGGAILAKTVFPQNQHVTKYDYHESGPSIVSRRL
jgi:actin-related protein